MKILERAIIDCLATEIFCSLPEEELKRVWPDDETRLSNLSDFVSKHKEWLLFSYTVGHGAVIMRKDSGFRAT